METKSITQQIRTLSIMTYSIFKKDLVIKDL